MENFEGHEPLGKIRHLQGAMPLDTHGQHT